LHIHQPLLRLSLLSLYFIRTFFRFRNQQLLAPI
jgi:hypothetical protein